MEERRRELAVARSKPWIDTYSLRPLGREDVWEIVIEGVNLHGAVSPPTVTLGGVKVEDLEFRRDGEQLRGVVRHLPEHGRLVATFVAGTAECDLPLPKTGREFREH